MQVNDTLEGIPRKRRLEGGVVDCYNLPPRVGIPHNVSRCSNPHLLIISSNKESRTASTLRGGNPDNVRCDSVD